MLRPTAAATTASSCPHPTAFEADAIGGSDHREEPWSAVRPLTEADRPQAIALWRAAGLTRPWNDPGADFDRALTGVSSTLFGAWDGAILVASVMVGHDGHRGWVYYLAVDADRRRQALGRRMMETAENWLRDQEVPKLNLMVRHSNADARSFYERLGYLDDEVTVLSRHLTP